MPIMIEDEWASINDMLVAADNDELALLCVCDPRALALAGRITQRFGVSALYRAICRAKIACACATPPKMEPPPFIPPPMRMEDPKLPPLVKPPPAESCPVIIPDPKIWESQQ